MALAPLLRQTICPHCWAAFAPEEVLWVSTHPDLVNDPRLGPEQPLRFLPSRFDVEGNALDARGVVCRDLACPHCHLGVPRALLEMEPLFASILGTPACGKSYYLTAMSWELRQVLAQRFALTIADTDAATNLLLREWEERLFLNPRRDELTPLSDLIRKTEEQGDQYDTVLYDTQAVRYPRPFLFTIRPQPNHPRFQALHRLSRVLCLYDNAGESFLAGKDTPGNPVTRHLARSEVLLFLFDPLQDQRFRLELEGRGLLPAPSPEDRFNRQELVLFEAAARVRRYARLGEHDKHDRPLVVIVTKRDAWEPLLGGGGDERPPWREVRDGLAALDRERVERDSRRLRALLAGLVPDVVTAAESFARKVVYVGVSALGTRPSAHETGLRAIRPRDLRPQGAAVPMLYGLSLAAPGLIPVARRKRGGDP